MIGQFGIPAFMAVEGEVVLESRLDPKAGLYTLRVWRHFEQSEWEEKRRVLKRRVQAPKGSPQFCGTFGVLKEGLRNVSQCNKLVGERFCRIPKGSAELWAPSPTFAGPAISSPKRKSAGTF